MMDIIKISSPDAKGTANLNIVTEGIDICMYSTGKIEKLIPEKVTNKVNYYYIDSKSEKIFLKQLIFRQHPWRQTAGAEQKYGIGGQKLNYCQLIDYRHFSEYNSNGIKFKLIPGSLNSKRFYVDIEAFAILLLACILENTTDLVFNGFSTQDGNTAGGSSSHLNGMIGDVGYFSIKKDGSSEHLFTNHSTKQMNPQFDYEREKRFTRQLHQLGCSQYNRSMLSEFFMKDGKKCLLPFCDNYAKGKVRHYHHLHIQGIKTSLIIVKAK